MKLRKGDTVKVLSGNDKGKTGEILSVDVKNNKYKKIPNQEDWVMTSDNGITSLLKNIFKEDLLEKCNITNF